MQFEKLSVFLQNTRYYILQFLLVSMICSFSRKTHTLRRTCWRGLLTKNSRKVGDKRRWRRVGRGEGWRVWRREHTCRSWWETWGNFFFFSRPIFIFLAICVSIHVWKIEQLRWKRPIMQKECYKIYRFCFTIDLWHYVQTLWILLLFWVLRVWGIDCSCKR